MAQKIINIGSTGDDGTGTNWRDCWDFTNDNFTELFGSAEAIGVKFISKEEDFEVQDGSTITLESKIHYIITNSITTAKSFIVLDAAVFSSSSLLGPTVTYTGLGSMFSGTDVSFSIRNIRIDHPNAQGFNFTDTAGGLFLFLAEKLRTVSGTKWGTFNDLQTVLIEGSSALDVDDGLSFTGTTSIIISADKFFIQTTSATFVGIDLGTAIAQTIEFNDLILVGPAGSVGIKGAANSANVPSGSIATVTGGNFAAIGTPLDTITVDDIRWDFVANSAIPDTMEDALLSFNGSSTETTIGVGDGDNGNPKKVTATWTCIRESFFTCDTNGRITFNGERGITVPIDVHVGLISSGGGSIDVTVYLAKNGTAIAASATTISISGSNQALVGIPWQDSVSENDFYEIFIENSTNTTNIIVESGKLRVA